MPATAFAASGARKVRCQACAFEWTAVPDEPNSPGGLAEAVADATDEPEPPVSDLTARKDDFASQLAEVAKFERNVAAWARSGPRDIESAVRRNEPVHRPSSGGEWKGWLALAACLALLVGGAYEYRREIVAGVPTMAAVYEAVGLGVNLRGMEFANVTVAREFDDGLPVLAVRGEIVNVSERAVDVPRVRFGLRDGSAAEIYHWTLAVAAEPLAPAARTRFTTRLAAPPREAHDVVVRFHEASDHRARLAR